MHRQIYGALRRFILDGQIAPHTLLPSTRSLAEDLKVGRNTVIAAYDQLLAEGFIEARAGSGTWVAPIKQERPSVTRARARATRAICRTVARPSSTARSRRATPASSTFIPACRRPPPFPSLSGRAFWCAIRARATRRCSATSPSPAIRVCAPTIASNISVSRGIDCAPEQVIVVTGAQAALDLVSRVLMDEGDHVWMEEPGYLGAKSAFLASGAKLAPLKVDRRGWNLVRSGPAAAAPDLCDAVLPVAVRHHHAHRGAAAAARHRRAPWGLDDRGRFRRRIPLSRPPRAGLARARSRQPRRLYRQLRQDAASGAAHRLSDRSARTGRTRSTRPCRSPASSRR